MNYLEKPELIIEYPGMTTKTLTAFMAERLRQLREERRLTQKEVGAVIGVSNTALSNREAGDTPLTPEEILIFSHYFGVSCAFFFGEGGPQAKELTPQESGLVQAFRECSDSKKLDVYDFSVRAARASKLNH